MFKRRVASLPSHIACTHWNEVKHIFKYLVGKHGNDIHLPRDIHVGDGRRLKTTHDERSKQDQQKIETDYIQISISRKRRQNRHRMTKVGTKGELCIHK